MFVVSKNAAMLRRLTSLFRFIPSILLPGAECLEETRIMTSLVLTSWHFSKQQTNMAAARSKEKEFLLKKGYSWSREDTLQLISLYEEMKELCRNVNYRGPLFRKRNTRFIDLRTEWLFWNNPEYILIRE